MNHILNFLTKIDWERLWFLIVGLFACLIFFSSLASLALQSGLLFQFVQYFLILEAFASIMYFFNALTNRYK